MMRMLMAVLLFALSVTTQIAAKTHRVPSFPIAMPVPYPSGSTTDQIQLQNGRVLAHQGERNCHA